MSNGFRLVGDRLMILAVRSVKIATVFTAAFVEEELRQLQIRFVSGDAI